MNLVPPTRAAAIAKRAKAETCPQGHPAPYGGPNVYLSDGYRKCRTCVLARMRRYYLMRKSAVA